MLGIDKEDLVHSLSHGFLGTSLGAGDERGDTIARDLAEVIARVIENNNFVIEEQLKAAGIHIN